MRIHLVLLAIAGCAGTLSCTWTTAAAPRKEQGRRILYYHDPMHPSYRSDRPGIAPDCNMALTPVYADEVAPPALVRVSEAQAAAIGIRTEAARDEASLGQVRTIGRVEAQESRRYQVTAGADGWIRAIRGGESGSFVVKGQSLASYYSRDITTPQQAYLYALDAQQRLATNATEEQKDLAAKQLIQARDYLEFLGLTAPQIAELARSRQEAREVTLGAPASGLVLQRNVSAGSRFDRGEVLWEIADITAVWITADLFPEDLQAVSGARTATVTLPGGTTLHASVDSFLPRFEDQARVAKLRLTASNPDQRLLPGMTVTVAIPRPSVAGLTVPSNAVIESGIKPRVYVRRSDGTFEPRPVTTGWRNAGRQQILSGLRSGEEVVTDGAFLIDSESRLR